MIKRNLLSGLIFLCTCIAWSASAFGEPAWVSDQFEIMLRTGPSTNNAIQLMVGSGVQLEVLERDAESGYSRVRTNGGTEGWVLSRYLVNEPGAREQLETLTRRLTNINAEGATMNAQLEAVSGEYETAKRRIASLEKEKATLEKDLADIRKTSANAIAIDRQNKELRQQLTDAEIKVSLLEQEKENLSSETNRNWFVTGALVLFGGVLLGVILPRLKMQRKSRYDRF